MSDVLKLLIRVLALKKIYNIFCKGNKPNVKTKTAKLKKKKLNNSN